MKRVLFCVLALALGCGEGESTSSDGSGAADGTGTTSSGDAGGDESDDGNEPMCPGGELCPCDSDEDCLNGLECASGVCVRREAPDPDPPTTGDDTSDTGGDTGTSGGGGDDGGCNGNLDCADDQVCEPDGDCDEAFNRAYHFVMDSFCNTGGCPGDGDCEPEYFFRVRVDGTFLYEWEYYDPGVPCAFWGSYPYELTVKPGTVLQIEFWDYDSTTGNDQMTEWCSSTSPSGGCEAVTLEHLHGGVDDSWTDADGDSWKLRAHFEPL